MNFIHPNGLHRNPTNVVMVAGPAKTIYVGGQNAVDISGAIVGKGDLKKQTEQILTNIQVCLAAAGARPEHVVKWTLYVVQGQSLQEGFEGFSAGLGKPPPSSGNLSGDRSRTGASGFSRRDGCHRRPAGIGAVYATNTVSQSHAGRYPALSFGFTASLF